MIDRVAIDAVMIGESKLFARGEYSSFDKRPVDDPVAVGVEGLVGDTQTDRRYHGGPDKAVHFYPADHYAFWADLIPDLAPRFVAGGFGENLSASGLTEDQVFVGDHWQMGSVIFEVAQGRQPCWKVDARFNRDGVVRQVVKTGRSGWYFRVIQPGVIVAGENMQLVVRPQQTWSVARVTAAILLKRATPAEFADLARLPALAQGWRERAERNAA